MSGSKQPRGEAASGSFQSGCEFRFLAASEIAKLGREVGHRLSRLPFLRGHDNLKLLRGKGPHVLKGGTGPDHAFGRRTAGS